MTTITIKHNETFNEFFQKLRSDNQPSSLDGVLIFFTIEDVNHVVKKLCSIGNGITIRDRSNGKFSIEIEPDTFSPGTYAAELMYKIDGKCYPDDPFKIVVTKGITECQQ